MCSKRLVGRLGDQLAGEAVAAVLVTQHPVLDHLVDVAGRPVGVAAEDEVDLAVVERRPEDREPLGDGPRRARRSSADISDP